MYLSIYFSWCKRLKNVKKTTNLGLQWEIVVIGRVLPKPWKHARQNGQIGNWFLSLGRQTWIGHRLWWRYRVRKSSRHIWDRGNKCDHLSNELSENGKKYVFSEMLTQVNLIGAPIRFPWLTAKRIWSHLSTWSEIFLLLFLTRYCHHNWWPIHVCLPRERNQLPFFPWHW